jgi:EAL domain-containing protein (putative c-di-GMP-specific phosphodiesterase class I)
LATPAVDAVTHVARAESACWQARSEGAGRICYHQHSDEQTSAVGQPRGTDALERALRKAGGLQNLYEPMVALGSDERQHYRVDLRLKGAAAPPATGRAGSDQQLVAARQDPDLSVRIDLWSLRKALKELAKRDANAPRCRLFVPQRLATLRDSRWLASIREQLSVLHLPRVSLVLCVDLDDLLANLSATDTLLPTLARVHIGICLEGFRLDQPSRSMLAEHRPAFIAPPPALVADPDQHEQLRLMIGFARTHDARLVARGVTDLPGLSRIWNSGADFVAGSFIQPALPAMTFDFSSAMGA